MIKVHPPPVTENALKLGRINLPTVTLAVLLLCIFLMALMAVRHNPLGNFFYAALFLFCPIASILGLSTLIWCFVKRKGFTGEDDTKHFREVAIIGVAAFASPIWIIILLVMIFGFNR